MGDILIVRGVKINKNILFIIVFILAIVSSRAYASCGISPGANLIDLHPGETTAWSISLTMEDYNDDGSYISSVSISDLPYPELEWASLSPDNITTSIIVNSTTVSSSVIVYINNNSIGIPFGYQGFKVLHACECTPEGDTGGCLANAFLARITIVPYTIQGLNATFSPDNINNTLVSWGQFLGYNLSYLYVLRTENGSINTSNYQDADILANLSSNETSYLAESSDPCRNYKYSVYGFIPERLMVISASSENYNFGPPSSFFLASPQDQSTLNSTFANFSWQAASDPYPNDTIGYSIYLSNNSEFTNADVFESDTNFYSLNESLVEGQTYYWKVMAKDASCGFEASGSDATNYAAQSNGGIASGQYYAMFFPEEANDGNYATFWRDYGGQSRLRINFSAPQPIGRIKIKYNLGSEDHTNPSHDLEIYAANNTLMSRIEGNPDNINLFEDFTFNPVITPYIEVAWLKSFCYAHRVFEVEAYNAVGSFAVLDFDKDGIRDQDDNCPYVFNPGQMDMDNDSIGDACDNCPNINNTNQTDFDNDDVGDVCDICPYDEFNDMDNDSVCGNADNCPNAYNLGQSDINNNGEGDACEDIDQDGLLDSMDNCPFIYNLGQNDTDNDSSGDACDNCIYVSNPDQNDSDSIDSLTVGNCSGKFTEYNWPPSQNPAIVGAVLANQVYESSNSYATDYFCDGQPYMFAGAGDYFTKKITPPNNGGFDSVYVNVFFEATAGKDDYIIEASPDNLNWSACGLPLVEMRNNFSAERACENFSGADLYVRIRNTWSGTSGSYEILRKFEVGVKEGQLGMGDLCDNCAYVLNPGQKDSNDNSIGDACEILIQKINLSLTTGWNLISFPLNLINKSISSIFMGINYSKIFYYNSSWIELNDNSEINESYGYWVNSLESQTLEIEGNEFNKTSISLNQGRNLIGYPSLNTSNVTDFFRDINITNVFAYNGTWLSYNPSRNDSLNTLKQMKPGYGYWVNAKQ
ncbi:MAG: thrombospondin type 3 repeat-containing protein [Nanoarchaeota archaeon]|nr:thrombospondin type 3 repeat-containing protein [Nanoarchaeota archaeon]MBU1945732.1 thrombospondin type 3 repeat-containing protein [Nanoarchaeota archaeon]